MQVDALREQPVDPTDPGSMAPSGRRAEIASILARGYLRHVHLRSENPLPEDIQPVSGSSRNDLAEGAENERTCVREHELARL